MTKKRTGLMPKSTCYLIVLQDLQPDGSFVTNRAGLYGEPAQGLTSLDYLSAEVLHCDGETFEDAMHEVMREVRLLASFNTPKWVALLAMLLPHYARYATPPKEGTD